MASFFKNEHEQLNPLASMTQDTDSEKVAKLIRLGKSQDAITFIKEHNVDINSYAKNGNTLSTVAVFNGDIEVLAFLHKSGASIFKKNEQGSDATSIFSGRYKSVFNFLCTKDGFEANTVGENGITPLQNSLQNIIQPSKMPMADCAIRNNKRLIDDKIYIINKLISMGANINHQNDFGRTVLFSACHLYSLPLVETLMSLGSDPSIRDREGNLALDFVPFSEGFEDFKKTMTRH